MCTRSAAVHLTVPSTRRFPFRGATRDNRRDVFAQLGGNPPPPDPGRPVERVCRSFRPSSNAVDSRRARHAQAGLTAYDELRGSSSEPPRDDAARARRKPRRLRRRGLVCRSLVRRGSRGPARPSGRGHALRLETPRGCRLPVVPHRPARRIRVKAPLQHIWTTHAPMSDCRPQDMGRRLPAGQRLGASTPG